MLNWVAVLRRILRLYNVRTQQELGMALGVPVNVGLEGGSGDLAVPWPILEMIVADKGVSWDWLLTGRHFRKDGPHDDDKEEPPQIAAARARSAASGAAVPENRMPRLETRELARALLSESAPPAEDESEPESGPGEMRAQPADAACDRADVVMRELEQIKAVLLKEIARVEKIMAEKAGGDGDGAF